MHDPERYPVFFDLDRTILSMNTGFAAGLVAYRKGLAGKSLLIRGIMRLLLYKAGLKPAESLIPEMGKWLRGVELHVVSDIGIQAVESHLSDALFEEFNEEFSFHRKRGAYIAILSSAISEICSPLALRLGFDSVICTEMEYVSELCTGKPVGHYCYGAEKRSRMEKFCREAGMDIESAWYYADSLSDFAALEAVGNPVCINPDRKLKKIAVKRGWRIEKWNTRAGGRNREGIEGLKV